MKGLKILQNLLHTQMPLKKCKMSSQVRVNQGVLQGKECTTFFGKKYYSFEGIPYAKPPVGKLRFRNPELPDSWTGIRDATKPGDKCFQINLYSKNPVQQGSEDCLYLNVYTPYLPAEKNKKLPVIFFVHGGRFIYGYGDYYKPDYLIKHDVILVTINYRLSMFGLLCLHLPEAPGNVALKDTIFALRWVQQNIEHFNGDSNNVTAFGESAGAGIVTSYLTSKMADGLFHKVIAQSGNALGNLFTIDEEPLDKCIALASHLGKELTDPRMLYDFFIDCSTEELLTAFRTAEINRHPGVLIPYLGPVIEKMHDGVERYFSETPRNNFMNNRFNSQVPVLSGQCSHEGALFVQTDSEGKVKYQDDLYYYWPRHINIRKEDQRSLEFQRRVRELYFNNKPIDDTMFTDYVELLSMAHFRKSAETLADVLAKSSSDVYYYDFWYSGNLNTKIMRRLGLQGACHGDMVQYQFYNKGKHDETTENDKRIIDFLSETWCNFAKNGKPTWSDQKTKWLPYTEENKHILTIDSEIKLMKLVESDKTRFWKSLRVFDREKPLI